MSNNKSSGRFSPENKRFSEPSRDWVKADLVIQGAAEILTCLPDEQSLVGRLQGGTIAIAGQHIVAIGSKADIERNVDLSQAQVIDATGKIVAPGFIDSHTHLVFGGSRAKEYGLSMTHSRQEIEAMGLQTGILATMTMTRSASTEELTESGLRRLQRMMAHGTTTVESKSGYGLSLAHEMKMLIVNKRLQASHPVDVVSTFLGAHEFPPELDRRQYLDLIVNEMIPVVAEAKLAAFCDVYCDDGYYTVQESRQILEAGLAAGLAPKIHTDAYSNIGGAAMAAELGVVSADHLNYCDRSAMGQLAAAGVTAVVMPALDFCVQHARPFNGRAMLDEGLMVALATDFCPACWVESMQFVMALACRLYRFTPEEALYAATVGGAHALALTDRGTLEPGKLADLQLWTSPSLDDIIYRLGTSAVDMVIKRGKIYQFNRK